MSLSTYNLLQREALTWRRLYSLVAALYAAAFSLPAAFVVGALAGWSPFGQSCAFILLFAVSFGAMMWKGRGSRVMELQVAQHLDRTRPELEESATLLLRAAETLNPLESLQRERVQRRLTADPPRDLFPLGRLYIALACFAAAVFVVAMYFFGLLPASSLRTPENASDAPESQNAVKLSPIGITSLQIEVSPPAYTGLATRTGENPDIEVAEDARILWRLHLDRPGAEVRLVFADGDTLNFRRNADGSHIVESTADASRIYHFVLQTQGGETRNSAYHRIEIVPDAAPLIVVREPDQRTVVDPGDEMQIPFEAIVEDDYGLGSVSMIATVTKGTGENVRFREDTLRFERIVSESVRRQRLYSTLDLPDLGLEPGDELYFHLEAEDRREPAPRRSRSETYFVLVPDTARQVMSFSEGLPIDRLPAYFRSQRQIIIDTERLIAERTQIGENEFRERSNDLGIDQKLLRLRYGQYLGEEFETDIGPESAGDEHELEAPADPNQEEDPAEAFTHFHDYEENATLFSLSAKTLLKSALAEMWDAELQLRLYRPAQALPYEYRALDLLKEVQQRSRIYVKRIGFEPTPVRPEEQRLSGDLEDIESRVVERSVEREVVLPDIRAALPVLQRMKAHASISDADRMALERAGQAMARVALEEPGRYLDALQNLRTLISNQESGATCSDCLLSVERAFWQLLPPAPSTPVHRSGRPGLTDLYFERLGSR